MCGIAGYIGIKELSSSQINQCLKLMDKRGPDHSALYHHTIGEQHVYLLHSRLSIIDLDPRSHQPFRSNHQMLTYNGELYNYLELKQELVSKGEAFSTQSDTEVLLKTIQFWGLEQALDKFEGMWAFAIYDEDSGQLTLSRDRFGEKPLYLFQDENGFFFASEIKYIQALIDKKLQLNYQHIYRYLINGYKSLYKTKETFFLNLTEVPSAHFSRIQNQELTHHTYWQYKTTIQNDMSLSEAIDLSRNALIQSVKLRLRADVPLAFCMSGGVDSNALLAIAKKVFNYDVHGFTIVSQDERYDERDIVQSVISQLNIRHTMIEADPVDFLPRLKQLIQLHDAPIYTISYYAHWLLMEQIARASYKISISGTAADELFSGYYDHYLAHLSELPPQAHQQALSNWRTFIQPVVRNPYLNQSDLFKTNPNNRDYIYLNQDIFSTFLRHKWSEPFQEKFYSSSLLRNRMLNELFEETVPVILHEDDHNAMSYSIENRSPFLDRNLFEVCYSIPTRYLIQNGYNKFVLRQAMKDIVPEEVLHPRKKVGFNASLLSFLNTKAPEIQRELLSDSPIFELVKKDAIEQMLHQDYLLNSESKFLFNFINSRFFLELYA